MNGYERISNAIKGIPADRVPVMLHNFMMAAREAGISMEEFRSDAKKMADAYIKSVEKYGFDGLLIDLDTVTLAGAAGVPVDYPLHEPARPAGSLLKSISEVKNLKPVDLEHYKHIMVWLEAVRKLKEYFGDTVFVRGNCDQAPFSLATMIRGVEGFMVDLFVSEEEYIVELLEYCGNISLKFIDLMSQTGADMLSNGDSPAGPELISPDTYVKYALPYEKRMAEAAHNHALPYALHICGDTSLILESMLETGSDAYELDYKTDPLKLRKILKGRATFIGNLDPSGVLALGTPEIVRAKTLELLDIFGIEDRFIINAGCALPAGTPPENIREMIKTAREYR
jgi:MtaA/CmuA family methyltransferase